MGFSEWAAFTEYSDEEAATWLAAAIEWGYGDLPTPKRTSVPVNAILPAVAPAGCFKDSHPCRQVHNSERSRPLRRANRFRTILQEFLKFKTSIRKPRSDSMPMVVLKYSQAMELLEKLSFEGIELEYFEQPVATIAELAEMKIEIAKTGQTTLIAADESVRKSSDPLAVELAGAADILVLKAHHLVGLQAHFKLQLLRSSQLFHLVRCNHQSALGCRASLRSLPRRARI